MQITRFLAILFLGCLIWSCESAGKMEDVVEPEVLPVSRDFGTGWEFQRLEDGTANAGAWEEVTIPHTVRIEPLVVNDQWQGKALYEKRFDVGFPGSQKWFLDFEGVMQEARVFLNDSLAKHHKGGYLPFRVDISPFLKEGQENIVRVEVENVNDSTIPPGKPLEDLDFNYYGGIYRNVHLVKKTPIYITDAVAAEVVNGGGILVHFDSISASQARGTVKTHIRNETDEQKKLELRYIFTGPDGARQEFSAVEQELKAKQEISISKEVIIKKPKLWSPKNPNLYRLNVTVLADGMEVDYRELKTGIRDIRLTEDAFYLNGEKLFLNGTNRHQEYPYIGYALSDEAQYRDAYKIKEAGFNLVRLSHYPQATAFLEACDELGLLVMNAMAGWQFFEEGEFAENALEDVRDMVRRDRNHPSVVFWENSLNESEMSEAFIGEVNTILKSELPYEDTYSAGWLDHPAYDLFIPARQHAEPPHYWNNYNEPGRPLFIAEYGDWEYYAQNAGFNQTAFADLEEEERTSRQFRGSGEKALLQQAMNFQEAFNSNLKGEQTIGHANWLMFDYNRGYSNDIEASGIADIFRIPKFSYYFYKSQKAPYPETVMDTSPSEIASGTTTSTAASKEAETGLTDENTTDTTVANGQKAQGDQTSADTVESFSGSAVGVSSDISMETSTTAGAGDAAEFPQGGNTTTVSMAQEAPSADFTGPMVYIANYWTPSSTTKVRVFSNTQEVALYLNEELVERKAATRNEFSDSLPYPPFHFELDSFAAGNLRAVGYIDDRQVAEHEVKTPGEASQIALSVDFSGKKIAPDHQDMVFVYARILDENGVLVPTAEHEVTFSLEGDPGNAELIGGASINAEAGIASILLMTTGHREPIVVRASSSELGETRISLTND